jgi:hypothetical protein
MVIANEVWQPIKLQPKTNRLPRRFAPRNGQKIKYDKVL